MNLILAPSIILGLWSAEWAGYRNMMTWLSISWFSWFWSCTYTNNLPILYVTVHSFWHLHLSARGSPHMGLVLLMVFSCYRQFFLPLWLVWGPDSRFLESLGKGQRSNGVEFDSDCIRIRLRRRLMFHQDKDKASREVWRQWGECSGVVQSKVTPRSSQNLCVDLKLIVGIWPYFSWKFGCLRNLCSCVTQLRLIWPEAIYSRKMTGINRLQSW